MMSNLVTQPGDLRVRLAGGEAEGEVMGAVKDHAVDVKFDTGARSFIGLGWVEMIESEVGEMKEYEVTKLDKGTGLTCPRSGCGGKFLVNIDTIRKMKREARVKGVACPYCSRVSALP